jgi:hypothetical protein
MSIRPFAKLRLEHLDDRALPSTVVYTGTAPLSVTGTGGNEASVLTTVTEEDNGTFTWDYTLTNTGYDLEMYSEFTGTYHVGLTDFSLMVHDFDAVTGASTTGAVNYTAIDYAGNVGELAWQLAAPGDAGILIGGSFHCSFTTPPERVNQSAGWASLASGSGFAVGTVATPAAKVVSTTTMAKPTFAWADADKLPTSMTLVATVVGASGAPTGNVIFYDGPAVLGTVAVAAYPGGATTSGATLTIPTGAAFVASHSISAAYQGDGTYMTSVSTASDVELTESQGGKPPLPAQPNNLLGGNLTWGNYNFIQQPVQGISALTAPDRQYRVLTNETTLTITYQGISTSESKVSTKSAQFTAYFDAAKSFVLQSIFGGPQSASLLAHENLHLTINEWLATKALANLPAFKSKGYGYGVSKQAASDAALAEARITYGNLVKHYDDIRVSIDTQANALYDASTVSGANAPNQALWAANWQTYIAPLLAQHGWQ